MCSTSVSSHRRLKNNLLLLGFTSGLVGWGLGASVLFGWHTGNRALIQVLPDFVPMHYNTALCFLFCSSAVLLLSFRKSSRLVSILGVLVATIGLLTLLEYVAAVDHGIDQFLMKNNLAEEISHPGRMAPNTAFCFTLLGIALALPLFRWPVSSRSLTRSILASLVLGLGIAAFSGYFTGLEDAYGWGDLSHMSRHSSIGFVVLSLGLLAIVWSRDLHAEAPLPNWASIPAAVAILTVTLCFWQALISASHRFQNKPEVSVTLSVFAMILLIAGILLALAMAIVAYLAQKSAQRARKIAQVNKALEEEISMRQKTEIALEVHRNYLEELVAARTEELEQARLQAESASSAKSEFLSHMSHELRTPLNGILGYAQILQRDAHVTSTQRDRLQTVIDCGDHLLSLINDMLDFSKIEAGHLEIESRPVNLPRLIQGVADIIGEKASHQQLAFDTEVSPEVPKSIVSDTSKLRQILINLLANSVKFTKEGGVILQVTRVPDGQIKFVVADTGIGMYAEEIEEVFEPFKQTEDGKRAGGTGLGLAITKRITEAMGGSISVESEKEKGTVFSVTLPLVEAQAEETLDDDETEKTSSSIKPWILAEGQEVTILVADDRQTNRATLDEMLTTTGFQTIVAAGGEEVLDLLGRHHEISLVLVDVQMPGLDGVEVIKTIRSKAKWKDLKVIAITAGVFPDFMKFATAAGFDDFLGKPFRNVELLCKLQTHLGVEFVPTDGSYFPSFTDASATTESQAPATVASLPEETLDQLREALKVKNMTAIKGIAQTLINDSDTTAIGKKIYQLVQLFHFEKLHEMLEDGKQLV